MLKTELTSLEGVDEKFHELYKQEGEKFLLDVDGMPDIGGLKKALERERKTITKLNESLKQFDGVSIDEYQELQARRAALEAHDPSKIEEMINERVKKNNQTWEQKFGQLQETVAEKDARLSDLLISDELRKVGSELGVAEGEAMQDFVARGKAVFRLKDGVAVPMRGSEVLYGESGVEPLTMREFTKKLSETATHLFKPSGGGGADTSGNSKGGAGTVRSKADLTDDAAKAAYIGKFGKDAYLNLPMKAG